MNSPGLAGPGLPPTAQVSGAVTVPVFFHAKAGAGVTADDLRRAGAVHGLRLEPIELSEADADAAIDAWRAQRPPLWVAAGGDGTVARVAALALESGGDLGVLAQGTRNHFARDLGLPLELDAAVAVLAGGATRAVDVGELDGRVFVNNACLGMYTRFVLVREHEERRPGLRLWPALAKAAWHALRTSRDLEVRLHTDTGDVASRTPVLLVGNNRYTFDGLGLGQRERLDGGCLSVYVLRPRSRVALVWFGLRALVGAVSAPRDFDELDTDALVVAARKPTLEVALDGEVLRASTPLRFRIRARALRVRVPAAQAP